MGVSKYQGPYYGPQITGSARFTDITYCLYTPLQETSLAMAHIGIHGPSGYKLSTYIDDVHQASGTQSEPNPRLDSVSSVRKATTRGQKKRKKKTHLTVSFQGPR